MAMYYGERRSQQNIFADRKTLACEPAISRVLPYVQRDFDVTSVSLGNGGSPYGFVVIQGALDPMESIPDSTKDGYLFRPMHRDSTG